MPVRIRLRRIGKKKQPSFRIVIADSRHPRDGRFLETVGYYNPLRSEEMEIDTDRVEYWLKQGAKPTNSVSRLLNRKLKKEVPTPETEKESAETED